MAKEKIKDAGEEVAPKAPKQPKAASGYIATVGIETPDGRRFEAGEPVDGLSAAQIEAFIEMGAIAEGGK